MKKILVLFFLLFAFSFLISACHCKKKVASSSETATAEQKRDFEKEGYTKATVINYTVDGCTFLLQLDNGKKLEAANLDEGFKKDKLAVWIKYIPKKNGASVCMAGQMVDLTDIQIRK